ISLVGRLGRSRLPLVVQFPEVVVEGTVFLHENDDVPKLREPGRASFALAGIVVAAGPGGRRHQRRTKGQHREYRGHSCPPPHAAPSALTLLARTSCVATPAFVET